MTLHTTYALLSFAMSHNTQDRVTRTLGVSLLVGRLEQPPHAEQVHRNRPCNVICIRICIPLHNYCATRVERP
jgi:hypothetical protein